MTFPLQLRNELWKLFAKKRTYIGFGAFLIAQSAMLLIFRFTRWQRDMERMLAGTPLAAVPDSASGAIAIVLAPAHRPAGGRAPSE